MPFVITDGVLSAKIGVAVDVVPGTFKVAQ